MPFLQAQSRTPRAEMMDRSSFERGVLLDADPSKEGARLKALVLRQQLRAPALPLANGAPEALLSLFR